MDGGNGCLSTFSVLLQVFPIRKFSPSRFKWFRHRWKLATSRRITNTIKLSITDQQKEEKLRIIRIGANQSARIRAIRSFLLPNQLSGEGVFRLVCTSRRRGRRLTQPTWPIIPHSIICSPRPQVYLLTPGCSPTRGGPAIPYGWLGWCERSGTTECSWYVIAMPRIPGTRRSGANLADLPLVCLPVSSHSLLRKQT